MEKRAQLLQNSPVVRRTQTWAGSESIFIAAQTLTRSGYEVVSRSQGGWPLRRPPYPLETSLPGVFAVGDIRAESVKRVASAVGEGSMVVQFVHKVLAE